MAAMASKRKRSHDEIRASLDKWACDLQEDAVLATHMDRRIAPLVMALRAAGFRTIASCQGGKGHHSRFPFVAIDVAAERDFAPLRRRIIRWLGERGMKRGYVLCDERGFRGPALNLLLVLELREQADDFYAALKEGSDGE